MGYQATNVLKKGFPTVGMRTEFLCSPKRVMMMPMHSLLETNASNVVAAGTLDTFPGQFLNKT